MFLRGFSQSHSRISWRGYPTNAHPPESGTGNACLELWRQWPLRIRASLSGASRLGTQKVNTCPVFPIRRTVDSFVNRRSAPRWMAVRRWSNALSQGRSIRLDAPWKDHAIGLCCRL